jgi:hypothetical protein
MDLIVSLIGVVLLVAGLALLFGPWALVATGVVLAAAGLLVDWERERP